MLHGIVMHSRECAQQIYLVQAKAQGCKQTQEANTWHPQITKTILHQQVASLESGLEGDGLSKRSADGTPATLQTLQANISLASSKCALTRCVRSHLNFSCTASAKLGTVTLQQHTGKP